MDVSIGSIVAPVVSWTYTPQGVSNTRNTDMSHPSYRLKVLVSGVDIQSSLKFQCLLVLKEGASWGDAYCNDAKSQVCKTLFR